MAVHPHLSGVSAAAAMVAQRDDRRARRIEGHEEIVEFVARQLLDTFAPSNFPLTNPEIFGARSAPAA